MSSLEGSEKGRVSLSKSPGAFKTREALNARRQESPSIVEDLEGEV
jgi:hypothetical protein